MIRIIENGVAADMRMKTEALKLLIYSRPHIKKSKYSQHLEMEE